MSSSIKFHAKDFITSRRLCDTSGLWEHYELGRFLGEGAFGAVHSCVHLDTGAERACKIMAKSEKDQEQTREILEEYRILKELDHPNLIRVYELLEDDEAFYIITDLCEGGDLMDVLQSLDGGSLPEEDVVVIMKHLLSCVNYLHQHGWAHRDIKLENILLHDSDYNDLKVIDFGLAKPMVNGHNTRFIDIKGTPYYMAPEILEQFYGPKADIWAIGVIAYMLLAGFAPFEGEDDREILYAIADGDLQFDDKDWGSVSDEARDFVAELLTEEEDKRPTAAEGLQHPWLQNHLRCTLEQCNHHRSSTRASLAGLQSFQSQGSFLKQATCAKMASQLQHSDEVKDIGRAFQTLDQTGRGKLTKADLHACLAAMAIDKEYESNDENDRNEDGERLYKSDDDSQEEIDIDSLFEQVNFSGTGVIHYSEFVGACLLQKNLLDDVKIRQLFQSYDRDNKGYITRSDLKTALSDNSQVSDGTIDEIMRQIDVTGQGRIYFEDFRANMLGISVEKALPGKKMDSPPIPMRFPAPRREGRAPVQLSAKGA